MSAIICHYYHGQRVMNEAKFVPTDCAAFVFGLQGPDVFTYSLLFEKDFSPEAVAFCNTMATIDLRVLSRYFSQQAASNSKAVKSYVQGLSCYCVLAEETHPFIQYGATMIPKLNPEQNVEDAKNLVESSLDIILLRYETGKLGTSFNMKNAVPLQENLKSELAVLYAMLYQELTGKAIAKALVSELLAQAVKSITKLNDRTMLKRQFLKHREKKKKLAGGLSSLFRNVSEDEDYDYANVCENEWQWPLETREVCTSTYFDLYETAVKRAVTLLQ